MMLMSNVAGWHLHRLLHMASAEQRGLHASNIAKYYIKLSLYMFYRYRRMLWMLTAQCVSRYMQAYRQALKVGEFWSPPYDQRLQ